MALSLMAGLRMHTLENALKRMKSGKYLTSDFCRHFAPPRVCLLEESQHARLGDDRGRSLRIGGRPDWASNISTASTLVRPTSFIRSTAPENRLQKGFHFLTW